MQELYITPQTDTECESLYADTFDSYSMVCAGDSDVGVCSGDSGGPLFYDDGSENILLGVTSWTVDDCEYTYYKYGGFADVYEFVDWIDTKTNGAITPTSADYSDSIIFQPTIIGGVDAAITDHDYFVTLMAESSYNPGYYFPFCGGSYLGDGWVLTAAHCVDDVGGAGSTDPQSIFLLVGNYTDDMEYIICPDDEAYCYISSSRDVDDAEIGIVYYEDPSEAYEVFASDITVHGSWDDDSLENDIALINLGLTLSNDTLSLPSTDLFKTLASQGNQSVMVIGHGLSD